MVTFYNWQQHPDPPPARPYVGMSPNLAAVRAEMRRRWNAAGASGYVVRRIRGGGPWSSHAYGAAWDASISSDAHRSEAIAWLLAEADTLGIQAVHDYAGARIWRAGRGWKPQPESTTTGMGHSRHLHLETPPDRWADSRPYSARTARPTAPPPTLRVGSRGARVAALQRAMLALGYAPGPTDGVYGPRTAAAVTAMQRRTPAAGPADGIYGPRTAAAMIDLLARLAVCSTP